MRVRLAGESRPGGRSHNEDRTLRLPLRAAHNVWGFGAVIAVADGIGGHAAGEVASTIAVDTLREALDVDEEGVGRLDPAVAQGSPSEAVASAVRLANSRVFGRACESAETADMGTTLTALALRKGEIVIAHVGDSRAYRVTRDGIERLTEDHSWVQEQVSAGVMTEEEAERSPFRSHITRTVGTQDAAEPDISRARLRRGQVLLVCSDGLTDVVRDEEVYQTIIESASARDACVRLADLAEERGTEDNVSVCAADVGRFFETVAPTRSATAGAETQPVRTSTSGRGSGLRPLSRGAAPKLFAAAVALLVVIIALAARAGRKDTANRPSPPRSATPRAKVDSSPTKVVAPEPDPTILQPALPTINIGLTADGFHLTPTDRATALGIHRIEPNYVERVSYNEHERRIECSFLHASDSLAGLHEESADLVFSAADDSWRERCTGSETRELAFPQDGVYGCSWQGKSEPHKLFSFRATAEQSPGS